MRRISDFSVAQIIRAVSGRHATYRTILAGTIVMIYSGWYFSSYLSVPPQLLADIPGLVCRMQVLRRDKNAEIS